VATGGEKGETQVLTAYFDDSGEKELVVGGCLASEEA
jgi:hypothetical protein